MSSYINVQTVGIACGVGFLAYCLYFDHKRRNAPDYREKVRARREKERIEKENADDIQLPSSDDKTSLEEFFIQQIEIGENLIQAGDADTAVKHLSYAVVLCPQPPQLLQYMKEVLPSTAYLKLLEHLNVANKRVAEFYKKKAPVEQEEEDVE